MALVTRELKSIGDYDLLSEIGAGGAGVVYKARHRETEEIVALKMLLSQQSDNPIIFKRFEQEFRSARSFNHPHLVRALDFLRIDNVTCLLMEYVEGRSLGERLEFGDPLPVEMAIAVVSQISEALDWIHSQGLLHRDIKPDNIIVTPDGVAKLADLGLAKELLFDQSLTRTGSALGTPNFMAPEQFRDAKRVNHRSDIYSLAATFYQMVTGVIPFQNSSPFEAWVQKSKNELPPPSELMPSLPAHINKAILRGMSGNPPDRPATCAEFIADLTQLHEQIEDEEPWELIYDEEDGCEPLRISSAGLQQILQRGELLKLGSARARRASGESFVPSEQFSESQPLTDSDKQALDDRLFKGKTSPTLDYRGQSSAASQFAQPAVTAWSIYIFIGAVILALVAWLLKS